MRRLGIWLLVAALPLSSARGDPAPAAKGDLYILGVAFNQRPNKTQGVDSYNWCPEEIERLFRAQAKSFHRNIRVQQVLGKRATKAAILDGLAWLRKNATANDFVVMYFGCHGATDVEQGWGVDTMDRKQLWGHEIKAELAKLPCQALVFIETCGSGGFGQAHKKDPPVPANVTAFCACSGKQHVNNELDMAVAEALYGRADFNRNGVIELDELIRYFQLRYREFWPEPKTTPGGASPVVVKSPRMPGTMPLTRVSPALVSVVHNGTWYGAIQEKRDGNRYQVHMLGWSSRAGSYFLTSSVTREFVCLPADGRPLLVAQRGRWYPARLLQKQGTSTKVHYIGYAEDEVVAPERIFYPLVGELGATRYPYQSAGAGTWARIGPAAAWKNTRVGTVLDDHLCTIETNGQLYVTDLSSGEWTEIGKGDLGNTRFLFAAGKSLYSIETDGSLYQIGLRDGIRKRLGNQAGWKDTLATAVWRGQLYSIETAGGLYATNLTTGKWVPVGKPEFGNTVSLFAAGDWLYTIEKDGSLYRVNPKDGRWSRVGEAGAWKPTQAGTILRGRLYTVETSGSLYVTDLTTGRWQPLGKAEFAGTRCLFAAGSRLFSIERDGSLFAVNVR